MTRQRLLKGVLYPCHTEVPILPSMALHPNHTKPPPILINSLHPINAIHLTLYIKTNYQPQKE